MKNSDKENMIYTSKSGDIATEKIVTSCPKCNQKVRVPLFKRQKLTITCPKCKNVFKFDCRRHRIIKSVITGFLVFLALALVIADIAVPVLLIRNFNNILTQIQKTYASEISIAQEKHSTELDYLKRDYDKKVADVNIKELRQKASDNYASIWAERSNYNSRYAITPREKAQLEMVSLSKEKNRSIEEIVESIARKAAPNNSEINAYTTAGGITLDVNFDMSEVTTGEKGTKTKHGSIDSLKKETIRLISKVTTDIYEFCKDLELENIAIGCKHFVTFNYQYGGSFENNIVIYKISLDREDIKSLEHNPFLDIYAVTKYFQIEKDDFPSLYLEKMS